MRKVYKIMKGDGHVTESKRKGRYAGYNGRNYGKVFGRLDCRSGMRMKKENRVFFHSWDDAIAAGFRPCKNCKPTPDDTH